MFYGPIDASSYYHITAIEGVSYRFLFTVFFLPYLHDVPSSLTLYLSVSIKKIVLYINIEYGASDPPSGYSQ